MVTRIYAKRRRRMYLREHRKAKAVSAETMAGRLGVERESVYRLERHPETMTYSKQCEYADALQIEPEDLFWPPGTPSVDGAIRSAPENVQAEVAEIALRALRMAKG